MFDKISTVFDHFLSHFSFRQRFLLFSFIFISCVPFPFYWFIEGQNFYIKEAKAQIDHYEKQQIWNSLLNDILLYQLAITTKKNNDTIREFNERVLFNISAIRNRIKISADQEALSKSMIDKTENLNKIWSRISNNPHDNYMYINQIARLIEIILSELKQVTLGNNAFVINPHEEDYAINSVLCEMYRLQIYTLKLFVWEYLNHLNSELSKPSTTALYTNIDRIRDVSMFLNTLLENSAVLQSLIADPALLKYTGDKNVISVYLNELNEWVNKVEETSAVEPNNVADFLIENRSFTADLINLGIIKNIQNKDFHTLIRNLCILVISLTMLIVLFFVFFHVLTSHFFELNDHIIAFSRGKFQKCFCSSASDEFGPVGIAFDKMAQTVQEVVSELQRLGRKLTESIKQISQATTEENIAFQNDEKKIGAVQDLTKAIAHTTQNLANTMNNLSLNSEKNSMAEIAKFTLVKMGNKISSLTQRSTNILQLLHDLQEKLDNNKRLFLFLGKVSNQASLLSLNSSIEASNILTNKQIFVKISNEIKRFAEKTAMATDSIQKTMSHLYPGIDRIYYDTTKFLNQLNISALRLTRVNEHLNNMAVQALDQSVKLQTVNKIMQDQAQITSEIQQSLNNLVKIANENSIHTKYLDKSMQELSATAKKLQHVLDLFFHPKQIEKLTKVVQK